MKIVFHDDNLGSFVWELPAEFAATLEKRCQGANKLLRVVEKSVEPQTERTISDVITANIAKFLLATVTVYSASGVKAIPGYFSFQQNLETLLNDAEKVFD
ncbi:MAG: hypothetical protein Q7R65_03910 [bacterium]|nr:hypothetical protein [bacterium]